MTTTTPTLADRVAALEGQMAELHAMADRILTHLTERGVAAVEELDAQ